MKICSIDIECNQPSGRIIQIGASVWDLQALREVDAFNKFIDPNEPINWDHKLRGGDGDTTLGDLLPFNQTIMDCFALPQKEALGEFWSWFEQIKCKKVIQWGRHDMACIVNDSKLARVAARNYEEFDIKKVYKILYQPAFRLHKKMGLQSAIVANGMEFRGDPHNAYCDAYNTAKLFAKMFTRLRSFGEADKIYNTFNSRDW